MIHEILPSDVEFVRGMLNASHSDAEILASLTARGIPQPQAAALLDDVRHGREPASRLPFNPNLDGPRSARRRRAAAPAPPPPASRHHSHRRWRQRPVIPWWFVLLVLFFLAALWYALFEAGRHISGDSIDRDRHELPPPPGKER